MTPAALAITIRTSLTAWPCSVVRNDLGTVIEDGRVAGRTGTRGNRQWLLSKRAGGSPPCWAVTRWNPRATKKGRRGEASHRGLDRLVCLGAASRAGHSASDPNRRGLFHPLGSCRPGPGELHDGRCRGRLPPAAQPDRLAVLRRRPPRCPCSLQRRVRPLCPWTPWRLATGRPSHGVAERVGGDPLGRAGAVVPAAAVPHRPAAVAALGRPVAWACAVCVVALCVMDAVMPGPLEASGQPNPLGIDSARAALERSYGLDLLCFVLLTLLCAGSVVVHFRRAGGAERQQLKWFAAGAGQLAVLIALALGLPGLWNRWVSLTVSDVVFGISFALIPVTIGIAILRYRPYDIDRLIHRTLVYALLTALLAAVYAGLVLSLGRYSAASVASHRAGPWPAPP